MAQNMLRAITVAWCSDTGPHLHAQEDSLASQQYPDPPRILFHVAGPIDSASHTLSSAGHLVPMKLRSRAEPLLPEVSLRARSRLSGTDVC